MTQIYFYKGCRVCYQSNGLKNVIFSYETIESLLQKTDFEVSNIIAKTLKNNHQHCEFCGSNNWDIYRINIEETEVFSDEKIKEEYEQGDNLLLIVHISKRNGQLNPHIDIGENFFHDEEYCKAFYLEIQNDLNETVKNIPDSEFVNHSDGLFYICYTKDDVKGVVNQKFRFIGFSKKDILTLINQISTIK